MNLNQETTHGLSCPECAAAYHDAKTRLLDQAAMQRTAERFSGPGNTRHFATVWLARG